MAWSVLSVIPKVCLLSDLKIFYSYGRQAILAQVERDENIKALLQDIHDVFDLGKLAHSLKTVKSDSKQVQLLTDMFRHVCNCGDLIQSYGKHRQFCMSSFPKSFLVLNLNTGREANVELEVYRREKPHRGLPDHTLPAARPFP